jgi:hypothetical protein
MNQMQIVYVMPPKGCIVKECPLCEEPMIYDGKLQNCLWCELHKEPMSDDV